MNTDIATYLRSYIEQLPFIDKIGGLVRSVTFMVEAGEDAPAVRKVIPVDCGVTHQECSSGNYVDLMPDDKYKSVSYFEDDGVSFLAREAKGFSFESRLRFVCWLNLKKLGKTGCSHSALAIASILKKLPTTYTNSSPYTRIQIEVESEEPKTNAIFSKYTYDEEKIQYLMAPYDYFALNIRVRYTIPEQCITEWTNGQEQICDEN